MENIEPFHEFPKIARLSRDCIITEKLDGTNAQIYIAPMEGCETSGYIYQANGLVMWAGSRTRWITPEQDNYGFARWAYEHRDELMLLGPGRHFGEWWGGGVQRGYGLEKNDKRWSLFNTSRWCLNSEEPKRIPTQDPRIEKFQEKLPTCCGLVPVLYNGLFTTAICDTALQALKDHGSEAAPGFMKPEGIICFHVAANMGFKKTIEKDEVPKGFRV
jgi:hypothetical protein